MGKSSNTHLDERQLHQPPLGGSNEDERVLCCAAVQPDPVNMTLNPDTLIPSSEFYGEQANTTVHLQWP